MELTCRDEGIVPATPDVVYDVLTDLSTYGRWFTVIRTDALGPTRLAPGVRFRFTGERPDGTVAMTWVIEVVSLVPDRRIELRYAEGDLVGSVGWELEPVDGGTLTAYVYYGVTPTSPEAAAPFEEHGLTIHNQSMQAALDGLSRYITSERIST